MAEGSDNDRAESLLEVFLSVRSMLGRVVGRLVQPRDVEDIVQETFLRCFEASGKTMIERPKSFLVTTARNLAINHIDRSENRLRGRMASFDESTVPLFAHSAEEGVQQEERFRILCRALRELPLQCRRAIILKKVYGLSRKEVADYMGITESTVQKHIGKGMMLCAEYLRDANLAEELEVTARSSNGRRRDSGR